MASIYRSEDMSFCELILETGIAYKCIAALGDLSCIQFLNLNDEAANYKLKFFNEVRLCDDMERQIEHLEDEIVKKEIKLVKEAGDPPVPTLKEFNQLQIMLNQLEEQLAGEAVSIAALKDNRVELAQLQGVIELTDRYFDEVFQQIGPPGSPNNQITTYDPNLNVPSAQPIGSRGRRVSVTLDVAIPVDASVSQLMCITGVIDRDKTATFEMLLLRVGRGNIYVRSTNLKMELEDSTDQKLVSDVFITFFQGESLKTKVEQICCAFHARIYNCPEKSFARERLLFEIAERRRDIDDVLRQAIDHRKMVMETIGRQCRVWKIQLVKVKAIYHTMNMMSDLDTYLIAQCWCPTSCVDDVNMALGKIVGEDETGKFVFNAFPPPDGFDVPTRFNNNKVTKAFQKIVDAYSVAKYKEINPTLFTTITFPFLFAVMYGDLGHGFILTCFGLWMCVRELQLKKATLNSESFRMIFGGRYVILLMGLFSMYAGVIYNDCFSKAFNIFGSTWRSNYTNSELILSSKPQIMPNENEWPYPIGVDPAWDASDNRINFINSMKMKLSIIFGVSHMLFGIFLSLINHIHFREWVNIFCEFIPQILFISCLFLYMDALVIFKWIYFRASTASQAPSILINMINMCLFKYGSDSKADRFVSENLQYLQYVLFIVAIISVPWMLLIKPFYLRSKEASKRQFAHSTLPQNNRKKLKESRCQSAKADLYHQMSESTSSTASRHPSDDIEMAQPQYQPRPSISSTSTSIEDVVFQASSRKASVISTATASNRRPSLPAVNKHAVTEQFDFSEVFINQSIHTIEYVLGLISHTASYLRLWALSLAHSELSGVLWSMVLRRGLSMGASSGYGGCIAIFIIFTPWACLTVAILVLMEGMSAFLHALRLHWVEFQSKFYQGGGQLFQPFNFKAAFAT